MKELLRKITKQYKEGLRMYATNLDPIHMCNQVRAEQLSDKKSA